MQLRDLNDTERVTVSEGEATQFEVGFSAASEKFIIATLSSIYRDSITAIVREITSNCFDSHIEAGVDDAVQIRILNEKGRWFIEFEDVGTGISVDIMDTIYKLYGESSRRDSDEFIGAYGLGSKSPLTYYTRSFDIITRVDGIEYTYLMYARIGKKPIIEEMAQEETDKRNGTTIRIQIQTTDLDKWRKSLRSALSYFDNVVFNYYCVVDNYFKIYESKSFKFNNKKTYSSKIHIVLGKVAYPIDFEIVDITKTKLLSENLPIGVKFEIGELMVTPSREDIDYNDSVTVNLIIERVNESIDELLAIHKKQNSDLIIDNFEYWRANKDNLPTSVYFGDNGDDYITTSSFMKVSYLENFRKQFKPFYDNNVVWSEELYERLYETSAVITKVEKRKKRKGYYSSDNVSVSKKRPVFYSYGYRFKQVKRYGWIYYYLDAEKDENKNKFLDWSNESNVALIKKADWKFIPKKSEAGNLIGVVDRKLLIKELQLEKQLQITEKIKKALEIYYSIDTFNLYSDIEITESYEEFLKTTRKSRGKTDVSKEEVFLNSITSVSGGEHKGYECDVTKGTMYLHKWRAIAQKAFIIIYGAREDKETLMKCYEFLNLALPYSKRRVARKVNKKYREYQRVYPFRVEYVAQNYVRKLTLNQYKQEMQNVFNIKEFPMKHPIVAKICACEFVRQSKLWRLTKEMEASTSKKKLNKIELISLKYAQKLVDLSLIIEGVDEIPKHNDFAQSAYKLAVELNLLDPKIMDLYNECIEFFDKIPLIYPTIDSIHFESEILPLIAQEMKAKKVIPNMFYVNKTARWFGSTPPIPVERQIAQQSVTPYPDVSHLEQYLPFITDGVQVYL